MQPNKVVVNVDWDGNYCAGFDSIACVATGKTIDELKDRIAYSAERHIEAMKNDGDPIPAEFSGRYELQFKFTAQALLKIYQGIITQSALSRITGINTTQINHYATGLRTPREKQREKIVSGFHRLGKELLKIK